MWLKDESGEIYRVAKRTIKGMLLEAAGLDDERCKGIGTRPGILDITINYSEPPLPLKIPRTSKRAITLWAMHAGHSR
jgi:hypothetical protein